MVSTDDILLKYKGVWRSINLYWKYYGGFRALILSPYFHLSLLISCISWLFNPGDTGGTTWIWFNVTLGVLPNLLGFTLGGYAILLAFGDKDFLQRLSGPEADGSDSPFLKVNGTFVHFVLIQVLALLMAIMASAIDIKSGLFAFVGFSLTVYSVSIAAASVLAVLRISSWFDKYASENNSQPDNPED